MSGRSLIQEVLSIGPNLVCMPMMNDRRCHQAQTRGLVLVVVPGEESSQQRAKAGALVNWRADFTIELLTSKDLRHLSYSSQSFDPEKGRSESGLLL